MITFMPAAENARAMPRPMPLEPPVMKATLPFTSASGGFTPGMTCLSLLWRRRAGRLQRAGRLLRRRFFFLDFGRRRLGRRRRDTVRPRGEARAIADVVAQGVELVVGELGELRHALGLDAGAHRQRKQRRIQRNDGGAQIGRRSAGDRTRTVAQLATRPLLDAIFDQRLVDR